MTIRLSGMTSGLDTDSLVSELVKAYSTKTDEYKGEQTKLAWKQSIWSGLNTKVKTFYNKISSYRFSSSYNLKKTSVSDSTKASITASNDAVNGTQNLNITSLAKTGYLTGGKLKGSASKTSESTTLAELKYGDSTKSDGYSTDSVGSGVTGSVNVNGTNISLSSSDKISDVITKLKGAGVNANYDENNQRIFVSSKTSGKDNDFTLTANDENGAKLLSSLGLYTTSESQTEYASSYTQYADYTDDQLEDLLKTYNTNSDIVNKYGSEASSNLEAVKNYQSAKTTRDDLISKYSDNMIPTSAADDATDYALLKDSTDRYVVTDDSGNATVYTKQTGKDDAGKEYTYYTKGDDADTKYFLVEGKADADGNKPSQLRAFDTKADADAATYDETAGATELKAADDYLKNKYSVTTTDAETGESTKTNMSDADLTSLRKALKAISDFEDDLAEETAEGSDLDGKTVGGTDYSQYTLSNLVGKTDDELTSLTSSLTAATNTAQSYLDDNSQLKTYAENYAAAGDDADSQALAIQEFKDKIANAGAISSEYSKYNNSTAVRIDASDATIYLNGAKFTSNSNTFSINGLTINAQATTTTEEKIAAGTADADALSITTSTDAQSIYDSIKDAFSEYNSLINEITGLYNASSARGYDVLTDDEKESMTDTQIEQWETKIKDSLLRNDTTLSGVMNAMTSSLSGQFEINGKNYSLASFGIQTLGYLNSDTNEYNAYHIYGDEDDDTVSDKTDKLMAAINDDPETVTNFFQQLFQKLYTNIGNKMAASSQSSSMTIYNDKEMTKEYSEWTTTISDWEDKVSDMEDYYYSKFSSMESALSKLESSSSSLSSYLG